MKREYRLKFQIASFLGPFEKSEIELGMRVIVKELSVKSGLTVSGDVNVPSLLVNGDCNVSASLIHNKSGCPKHNG